MPIAIEGACAAYERMWGQAERSLAIRLLDMCNGPDQVELIGRLQRDVLVPLELDLIGSSAGSPPLGAVVIATAQAIDEHRP